VVQVTRRAHLRADLLGRCSRDLLSVSRIALPSEARWRV